MHQSKNLFSRGLITPCQPADKVVGTITMGSSPVGLAYDSSNGNVYVSNYGSNNVSIINGTTNKVIGKISVGSSLKIKSSFIFSWSY